MYTTSPSLTEALARQHAEQVREDVARHRLTSQLRRINKLRRLGVL